jgi:hypothetical protein
LLDLEHPSAKCDEIKMKPKIRKRGTHLGAWNRGRGADEGDRGGAVDCDGKLRGGGATGRGKGKEVVREEQGLRGTFYRWIGEGRGRLRRWGRRARWRRH